MNCEDCGAVLHRRGFRYCRACNEKYRAEKKYMIEHLPYYLKTDESAENQKRRAIRGEVTSQNSKSPARRAEKR